MIDKLLKISILYLLKQVLMGLSICLNKTDAHKVVSSTLGKDGMTWCHIWILQKMKVVKSNFTIAS